jgi:hypothetical protein
MLDIFGDLGIDGGVCMPGLISNRCGERRRQKEAVVPELRRESWQMKGKMTVSVLGRGQQNKKAQQ